MANKGSDTETQPSKGDQQVQVHRQAEKTIIDLEESHNQ